MAKGDPKWAIAATWRRYALFATKGEASEALKAWKEAREAEGATVKGTQTRSFTAYFDDPDVANQSAGIIKLADHPLCYIGCVSSDIPRLRAMEEAENPDFERYSAAAKALSDEWRLVETLG